MLLLPCTLRMSLIYFTMLCLLVVNMHLQMDCQTLITWLGGGLKKQMEKQFSTSYENIWLPIIKPGMIVAKKSKQY